MVKKITSLSAIALTTVFMSTGAFAHSGDTLADNFGHKILDGRGHCVSVTSGAVDCVAHAPAVVPAVVAPVPEAPKRTVESVSLAGDVLFAFDSAKLTDAGKASIDPVIVGSRNLNDVQISLFGHADSRGNADYNQKLSERRAQSVADYMVSKGVAASTLSAFGRGETEPVASNTTSAGRAQNRRVDVSLSGHKVLVK